MTKTWLALLLSSVFLARLGAQGGASPAPGPSVPRDPAIYFHNPRLEALGGDLQKAAGDVASGQIFDSQLSNLEAVSKLALDRIFSSARRASLAQLEGTRNWGALCDFVSGSRRRALPADTQTAEWERQIAILKTKTAAAKTAAEAAGNTLKPFADLLQEVGKSTQVIEVGTFLQERKAADITPADLRAVAKVQDAMDQLGGFLGAIATQPKPASTRSAAEQMKIDLAKAEIDHLHTLVQIEEKRLDGEHDVRGILTAINSSLTVSAPGASVCTLKFSDADGNSTSEDVNRSEAIEATLRRFRSDDLKLKTVVYLLENYAALTARADTPVRIAELRSAIEERRFDIRRDAIMARTYEQVLLIGAQRIANYYKGGIKPETLAQLANALATAGLIPTIALK